VIDTEAMMMLPICALERPKSSRITGMSGAIPNQPKKQTKKVIHVMWNALIGAVLKSSKWMEVALSDVILFYVFIT
jgi:hypothetical protein